MSGPMVAIRCSCDKWGTIRRRDIKRLKGPWLCADCRAMPENNPNYKGGVSKDAYHYKLVYPDHIKARRIARRAKKSRILIPQPCEVCARRQILLRLEQLGAIKIGAIQMHHDDYSKPLKVRWLCQAHHKK